jgi:hypothetical protein
LLCLRVLGSHTLFPNVLRCGFVLHITRQNNTRQKKPLTPLYCQTCSRPQRSRFLPSCVHLSACLRIDLFVLHMTPFCRDIFCRHGGHDLLRLYCRYLCLTMSLIGSLFFLHKQVHRDFCYSLSLHPLFSFSENSSCFESLSLN